MKSLLIYHKIMKANFKRPFSQYVKKVRKSLQLAIEDAVEEICVNPNIGEAKLGDLAGIRVYKFRFQRQEYLIAYHPPTVETGRHSGEVEFLVIDFYQVGSHGYWFSLIILQLIDYESNTENRLSLNSQDLPPRKPLFQNA